MPLPKAHPVLRKAAHLVRGALRGGKGGHKRSRRRRLTFDKIIKIKLAADMLGRNSPAAQLIAIKNIGSGRL